MSIAAETEPGHPTNRKLGVIILGASTFPHFPPSRHLDNESFARSAAAFRSLMADEGVTILGNPAILDLFDVDDDSASVLRRINAFLKSEPGLTDVLLYYCGHGEFLRNRTYYLTLKATEFGNEAFTVLPLWQLKLALEEQLMRKRVFLVFDCCFSGQAAKEWMSAGIGQVIEEQVFQSFPKRGTALIAASASGGPAMAPEGESHTMFTGALINTVSNGVAGEKRELSFRDIVDAVRAQISERYGSSGVAPEIHAPQQDEGDITFTPFFANRAFVPPSETKQERENFEFVVADLDHPLPRTRIGAVETLDELLLSTRSAAFREEILKKLRIVQKGDDSQRVRAKCEEILARWPWRFDEGRGQGAGRRQNAIPRGGGGANKIEESTKPEPRRVVTYANGDRYDGEVRDGKPNGHGVYTWPDGRQYDGEWRNGKRNGHGVYTWHDGRRYDGEWHNDKKNGHGVFTWPGGDRYDGEFLDDEYNGHGVYTWHDGGRYDGEWRNSKRVSRVRRLFGRVRRLFGLSGHLGGSKGANKIAEPTRPKKPFMLIPHSATGVFYRCVKLALVGLVIGVVAMTYDAKNSWHAAYDRYYEPYHHPTLFYAQIALWAGSISSAIAIRSFFKIDPRSKLHIRGLIFPFLSGCLSCFLLYITYTDYTFTK